ncbi:hypothetical protein CH254_22330 [Rhodococcus sp. 06-412-2C]|nr:hypothetical protein CH254_22330 [Rhodococcus sp. 06-412-2C]OZC93857.1 hypothetical protein CH279_20410 [Rhodococcus sp. 06-412-2B]
MSTTRSRYQPTALPTGCYVHRSDRHQQPRGRNVMGDRLDVSVAVLLDAAGRTDLAIEMASDDLAVVARDMSAGTACWPGAAGEAFSALLSAWEAADATLSTDVKDLARKLQASARDYAEAEARTEAQIRGTG